MTDREQVGENIAYLVERSGVPPSEAARAAQVDARTLQNWMQGKTVPDVLQAKRLCRAVGCTLNEIGAGV